MTQFHFQTNWFQKSQIIPKKKGTNQKLQLGIDLSYLVFRKKKGNLNPEEVGLGLEKGRGFEAARN